MNPSPLGMTRRGFLSANLGWISTAALAAATAFSPSASAAPAATAGKGLEPMTVPVRIALVSDIHLGRAGTEKAALHRKRFEKAIDAVNAARVDIVLVGGDITEDGTEAQFREFGELKMRFAPIVAAVPGNHDIGAKFHPGKSTGPTAERLARYESIVGPSSWVSVVNGLRIIGIASPLLGSGLAAEAAVWRLLEKELAAPAGPTLVLSHYPPFTKAPDEPSDAYWNIDPSPRSRLLGLLERGGALAMLCGHLHRPLEVRHAGRLFFATPPVAFGLPAGKQPQGWTLVTVSPDGGITHAFQRIED